MLWRSVDEEDRGEMNYSRYDLRLMGVCFPTYYSWRAYTAQGEGSQQNAGKAFSVGICTFVDTTSASNEGATTRIQYRGPAHSADKAYVKN